MTTPIITLADVKTFLPINASVSTYDATLTTLILVATRQIETFTRRKFAEQEYTEFFPSRNTSRVFYDLGGSSPDGTLQLVAGQELVLQAYPVDTAQDFLLYYDTSVQRLFDSSQTLINSDNYKVFDTEGRVLLTYPTLAAPQSIKIVYTAGYAIGSGTLSASAPDDLKHACIVQTIHMWNRSQPDQIGVVPDQSPEVAHVNRASISPLTPLVQNLLVDYIRRRHGRG